MSRICHFFERNNSYYFSRANQQIAGTKIYSLTQCSLIVNECDWHILAGNDGRIKSHCLTQSERVVMRPIVDKIPVKTLPFPCGQ